MTRLQNDPLTDRLCGNANVLRKVMDLLADDDQLPDIDAAVNRIVDLHFADLELRLKLGEWFLQKIIRSEPDGMFQSSNSLIKDLADEQTRLVHAPLIRQMLAVQAAWQNLTEVRPDEQQLKEWKREIIAGVAPRVAGTPQIQDRLQDWLKRRPTLHSLAISLLNLSGTKWEIPSPKFSALSGGRLKLDRAILDGADCTRMPLTRCSMKEASFAESNLREVNLRGVNAIGANFEGANFHKANLTNLRAHAANFSGANLSCAVGKQIDFCCGDLSFSCMNDAKLDSATFVNANLANANLERACLMNCAFVGCRIENANFQFANLERSNLMYTDLTVADFQHASFRFARLYGCRLEGMELPSADFESANLEQSVMTGSIMTRANLSKVNLRLARLAKVEWESVDLRYADLTGATFHMGTSRSGIVGSLLASEGSRTGFYTDDWNEQDFKAPEEIRKANLRGADLRGAIIDGVDFYLVDLRDALYDMDQLHQLQTTGAILRTRTH